MSSDIGNRILTHTAAGFAGMGVKVYVALRILVFNLFSTFAVMLSTPTHAPVSGQVWPIGAEG